MSVIAWVFLAVAGVMGGLALLVLLQILVALLVWGGRVRRWNPTVDRAPLADGVAGCAALGAVLVVRGVIAPLRPAREWVALGDSSGSRMRAASTASTLAACSLWQGAGFALLAMTVAAGVLWIHAGLVSQGDQATAAVAPGVSVIVPTPASDDPAAALPGAGGAESPLPGSEVALHLDESGAADWLPARRLLDAGADVGARSPLQGMDPEVAAELSGRYPPDRRGSSFMDNTALHETDSDYEILLNLDRPSTVDALSQSLGRPLSPLARSAFGWTDLHYAAILNLPELAERLLDSGANPDAMYNSVELLEYGVYDAIKSLVSFEGAFSSGLFVLKERCHLAESGAWAAAPRVTPLMLAALFGHVEVMVALLDYGADVGDALRAAVCGGATQTALWLLSRRVKVAPDELEDATHQAALGDRPEILLALFERAPRLRSKEHVEHLLFDAAQRNSADVLSALLARGANPDARNDAAGAPGTTPLHFAAEADTPRSVVVLLEHGADIDSRAYGGRTPLHWAMRAIGNTATSPPVVAELLARGADVDARDSVGMTPLHAAIGEYWWGGAEVLLDNGADVNAEDSQGRTPLHTVSSAEAVAGLLRHGADLHARDATGNTPLHLHVAPDYFSANVEAVMELLKGGADVNARNDAGDTPLALAADDELRALLRRYGAEWE